MVLLKSLIDNAKINYNAPPDCAPKSAVNLVVVIVTVSQAGGDGPV
jgi:hypothetical protein